MAQAPGPNENNHVEHTRDAYPGESAVAGLPGAALGAGAGASVEATGAAVKALRAGLLRPTPIIAAAAAVKEAADNEQEIEEDLEGVANAAEEVKAAADQSQQAAEKTIDVLKGNDRLGEFTRFDVRCGSQALETTLREKTLTVDWVKSPNAIFQLGEIQEKAGGPGSFNVIKGYVTDQLAEKVTDPAYVSRLTQVIGNRLGGTWTATIEPEGVKKFLILTRTP